MVAFGPKGDIIMTALSAYQDEPDHIFKSSALCLISREQLYLNTIGLSFVLQTHVIFQ